MNNRTELLVEMTRRKLIETYVGSNLKFFWVLFVPMVPILTSLLVFFVVARIPAAREMGVFGYAVFILTGILPYQFLQRALREASGLLLSNMEILKSVPMSLPNLVIPTLGVILFDFILQLIVLVILKIAGGVPFSWTIMLLPLALLLLTVLAIGLGWIISIFGYLARDIQQLIDVSFVGLLYLTPAVYPVSALPRWWQPIVQWNPLTHLIVVFRDVLGQSGELHFESWMVLTSLTAMIWIVGYICITKAQKFVGDMV